MLASPSIGLSAIIHSANIMSLTSLSTTFLAALLRDDPPASKFGAEVERAPAGQEADCDSDASSLLSYASNQDAATSNQDAATLPPELVGQILAEAASDRFELFVVEGQFEEIETQCRVSNKSGALMDT